MSKVTPWLLSLLLTAALLVGSMMMFMNHSSNLGGLGSMHSTSTGGQHHHEVHQILERQKNPPPSVAAAPGQGADNAELQLVRDAHAAAVANHKDELEVAALTEARLTSTLRETERKLEAALAANNVLQHQHGSNSGAAAAQQPERVAAGAGRDGVWVPPSSVFAKDPPIEKKGDNWVFDEKEVDVTYESCIASLERKANGKPLVKRPPPGPMWCKSRSPACGNNQQGQP